MKISISMSIVGSFIFIVLFAFIISAMVISEEISNEEEKKQDKHL